jgi:small GTP-binding protein
MDPSCVGKVVLIGESEVGKTSLVVRYIQTRLLTQSPTVGAVFHRHETTVDGVKVTLEIWDTAGQERYRSLGPIYYRKANAAIAVFDLSRPETLEQLDLWINVFREHSGDQFVVIVANKSDLPTGISPEQTDDFAGERGAICWWTSAKSGHHVNEVFDVVCRHILEGRVEVRERRGEREEVKEKEKEECGEC